MVISRLRMNRDKALFSVLFYMSKFFGVLPVSRNLHDNNSKELHSDCFHWCAWGGLATLCQLGVTLLFTYSVAPSWALFKESKSQINFYLWLQSCLSAIISLSICLCTRPKAVARCMSEACRIYHLPILPIKPMSLKLFFTMMVYPFLTMFYLLFFIPIMSVFLLSHYFKHDYFYIPVATVEVMFACCCLIAERAFTDINTRMKHLQRKECSKLTFDSMKELLESFVTVCEYAGCFSEFFSIHLLASFVSYTLRMIIYSVAFLNLIESGGSKSFLFTYAFLASYLTLRLFFICHWSQKLKNKSREFVSYMRQIRISWAEDTTTEQKFLLDTYENLIESSPVEFTACGLFPINVQQILSIIGLVITYAIVALQSKCTSNDSK